MFFNKSSKQLSGLHRPHKLLVELKSKINLITRLIDSHPKLVIRAILSLRVMGRGESSFPIYNTTAIVEILIELEFSGNRRKFELTMKIGKEVYGRLLKLSTESWKH